MIGASGAVSGILGGYLLLFPKAKIRVGSDSNLIPFFNLFRYKPAIVACTTQ